MTARFLRPLAAGVLLLQVVYVVVAEILLAVLLEDTSALDHTESPADGRLWLVLAEVAVVVLLFSGALLLAATGRAGLGQRVPGGLRRAVLGAVALVEGVVVAAVLLNITRQDFGPDVVLNVAMVVLSGTAGLLAAAEAVRTPLHTPDTDGRTAPGR